MTRRRLRRRRDGRGACSRWRRSARCASAGTAPPLLPPSDPLVPTTRVTRGPLELSVHATGELRASKSAMLTAPSVGGTLRILQLLDAGVSVKAGDVIAEFDPTEQQYALEQASRSSRKRNSKS